MGGGLSERRDENGAWSNVVTMTSKPKDWIGHTSHPSNWASEALQVSTLKMDMFRVT